MPSIAQPPYEYAQEGFENLIERLGPNPPGEDLGGRTVRVRGVSAIINGQLHNLVVRTADASYVSGSRLRLAERIAALYAHMGDTVLEQLVAYDHNRGMVVTKRVDALPLDRLPVGTVRSITREHLANYYLGLAEACTIPLGLDEKPGNTLFHPEGFTAIDYNRGVGDPGTPLSLYGAFVGRTLLHLAKYAPSEELRQAWSDVAALGEAVLAEQTSR